MHETKRHRQVRDFQPENDESHSHAQQQGALGALAASRTNVSTNTSTSVSTNDRALEARLYAHYRRMREAPGEAELATCVTAKRNPNAQANAQRGYERERKYEREQLAAAMVAAARRASVPLPSFPAFVAAQAHFIKPWMWAVHVALAAGIVIICLTGAPQPTCDLAIGAAATGMAIAGLPFFLASKNTGVAEIEFASAFNCHSVLLARMIALGCSEVLLLSIGALMYPALMETSAFPAFTRTFGPYLLACAGCLTITRRCPTEASFGAALAWSAVALCVLVGFATLASSAYSTFADIAWGLLAIASTLWTIREGHHLLIDAASGLDQLLPEMR